MIPNESQSQMLHMYRFFLPTFCHKSLHSRANAGKYFLHGASGNDWPNFGFTYMSDTNLRPPWRRRNIYIFTNPPILAVPAFFLGGGEASAIPIPAVQKNNVIHHLKRWCFSTLLLPSQTSIYANQ